MTYAASIQDDICNLVAQDKSLRQIEAIPGMPTRETVRAWLRDDPAFLAKYARAKDIQADAVFERMGEIEEQTLSGVVEPAAARAVLGSMQWRADKLAPRRYGNKLELSGNADAPLVVQVVKLADA